VPSRLPDSPGDRQRRDEVLRRIFVRVAIAIVPTIIVGALAVALGVPLWLVAVVCLVVVGIILFEA
jgi:heme A synthase